MKTHLKSAVFVTACLFGLASHAHATLLLSDNFNENNTDASTFNSTLAATQGGSLATVAYNVAGPGYWTAQHGNGNRLLVATDANVGYGSVSLNNNFATQANAANQPLQITFNIHEVGAYGDTSRWVQFNVGNSQNLDVSNGGVGVGIIFRVNGNSAGTGGFSTTWAADDLVTVTLSDTAGTGSAFNGNGSRATISIGANNFGPFALAAQQTNAFVTFSAYNYGNDQFGLGTFDNLNISLVPEPGSLAMLAFGSVLVWITKGRRGR